VVKRYGPAGRIADSANESHVFTRYDSPRAVRKLTPPGCHLVSARGVRIVTPAAFFFRHPVARNLFRAAEWALCDSPARVFGGFYVAVFVKGA
jgi:hypothetical protein